ncbi:hypothetical protein ACED66_07635 [Vibrio splendidus]|uniref:hypothetical protein n=1 Tax=Vibrio splendidus TaxID=29497 RepID=UPI000D3A2472|nr:hypothetical protein [Vibrio splendidus]PTQ09185.1 hypothetical protein CWO28_03300 [Vibrio splendidus]
MDVTNIDLTYILDGHGWSSCYLIIDNEQHLFGPTHILNNPLEELVNAENILIGDSSDVSFKWFDEPGLYQWDIVRDLNEKHLISISINTYAEWEPSTKPEQQLKFKCKLSEFLFCLYYQLVKLDKLLTDKSFSKYRACDFPRQAYKKFKSSFELKYS